MSVGPFETQPTLIMTGLTYSPVAVRAAANGWRETRKSGVSRERGELQNGEGSSK